MFETEINYEEDADEKLENGHLSNSRLIKIDDELFFYLKGIIKSCL